MNSPQGRRDAIRKIAAGAGLLALDPMQLGANQTIETRYKGNINHSVCSWTYNFLPLEEMCTMVKKLGFSAIDLLAPKDWPTVQKNGITCSMCYTAGKISLTEGWNNPTNHEWLIKDFTEAI